jgi:hypothetical protein
MSRRLKDIEQACERCGRARPDPRWCSSSPLRLLACSTRTSVVLIPRRCSHHLQQARSPAFPRTTSLTSRPDDPGKSTCFLSVISADGCGLPHLTTGSALSINKLRGSMGSLVVRAASLRCFPLRKFSRPLSPESHPLKTGSSLAGRTDNSPHRTLTGKLRCFRGARSGLALRQRSKASRRLPFLCGKKGGTFILDFLALFRSSPRCALCLSLRLARHALMIRVTAFFT